MAGTYKEILARFKKDLGNTYQAQKNIVDVSQKYIGLLENAEGGSGSGGIDYSTTEHEVGTWNNKKLYAITKDCKSISNVSADLGIDKAYAIRKVEYSGGYTVSSSTYEITAPTVIISLTAGTSNLLTYITAGATNHEIFSNSFSGTVNRLDITFYYTKD